MTSVSIEEEVIAFVAANIRVSAARLKARTTLFGDLGVDGDDSDELMVAFTKRFGVDMTTYRGDRHFGPEGFAPWTPFYWLVLLWRARTEKGSTPESRARLCPITIQDLIDSAKTGRWSVIYGKTAQQAATAQRGQSSILRIGIVLRVADLKRWAKQTRENQD